MAWLGRRTWVTGVCDAAYREDAGERSARGDRPREVQPAIWTLIRQPVSDVDLAACFSAEDVCPVSNAHSVSFVCCDTDNPHLAFVFKLTGAVDIFEVKIWRDNG